MSKADAAATFRALHDREGILVMPNPWDIGTARLLEALGFEAIATASAALAFGLGRADGCGEVSRDESLRHGRSLAEAVAIPVNGDLENGFGDSPNEVAETIRGAIAAGLAGCSIEDSTGNPARPLYDRGLALDRIRAAVEARDAAKATAGGDFLLTARCEAYLTDEAEPLAFCIDRLTAMAEAGADVVYACGMAQREDIAALVRAVPCPVNVLGGTGPEPLSVAELAELGVKRVSLGPRLIQAALGGFLRAAEELRGRGSFGFMTEAAQLGSVAAMIRR